MRSHSLVVAILVCLLVGCSKSEPKKAEFNAQVDLGSTELEFSEQGKALIEDANRDLEADKIPKYSIVYVIDDHGERQYYALHLFRTRSTVDPGDYFGPFPDTLELIKIRWLYDVFGMDPSRGGGYIGAFIERRELLELSDAERELYNEQAFNYAVERGIIEPED